MRSAPRPTARVRRLQKSVERSTDLAASADMPVPGLPPLAMRRPERLPGDPRPVCHEKRPSRPCQPRPPDRIRSDKHVRKRHSQHHQHSHCGEDQACFRRRINCTAAARSLPIPAGDAGHGERQTQQRKSRFARAASQPASAAAPITAVAAAQPSHRQPTASSNSRPASREPASSTATSSAASAVANACCSRCFSGSSNPET